VAAFGHSHVDVVELSDEVVQGSRYFTAVNGNVVHRRNVHVRVDNGRNYLLTTNKKYDVITADIIVPEHAGAGNIWSVEYWRLARDALSDNGIMLQWLPTRDATETKLIMRSFLKVFPYATLWDAGDMLIGSKHPLTLDRAAFERRLQDPQTRSALESVGITNFNALVGAYTAGPEEMRAFAGRGPLLTDDRPRLEYSRYLLDFNAPRPPDLSPLTTRTDPREILRG
jgi:spermidine synthase